MVLRDSKVDETRNRFNNVNKDLQFTVELEENKTLNFLDMTLKRRGDRVISDWYNKPTASHRLINYFSHHPTSQKIAIVYNLVDRAIKLSDNGFHNHNLDKVRKTLNLNDYPKDFYEKYISKRLHTIKHQNNNNINSITDKQLIILPYINNLSQKINSKLKKNNIFTVNKNINKFNKFIKLGKDRLTSDEKSNIVYKIDCKDCDMTYIGQSKRYFKTRKREHKYAIDKQKKDNALFLHVHETGHEIDFKNPRIVDTEKKRHRRLLSEMINIHYHDGTMNNCTDTAFLKQSYKQTIDYVKSACKN